MLLSNLLRGLCASVLLVGAATSKAGAELAQDLPRAPTMDEIKTMPDYEEAREALSAGLRETGRQLNGPLGREIAENSRRADGIANEKMGEDRDAVLKYLGIDPKKKHQLFILVSSSMPMPLLKQYTVDAAWAGATIVWRGAPPGRSIGKFLTQDMRELIQSKNSAFTQVDPRIFDMFSVDKVPTIVLAKDSPDQLCAPGEERLVEIPNIPETAEIRADAGPNLKYHTCAVLADDQYWKIEGQVSLVYALDQMQKDGAPAEAYINALRKSPYWRDSPDKTQSEFKGEWVMRDVPIVQKPGR